MTKNPVYSHFGTVKIAKFKFLKICTVLCRFGIHEKHLFSGTILAKIGESWFFTVVRGGQRELREKFWAHWYFVLFFAKLKVLSFATFKIYFYFHLIPNQGEDGVHEQVPGVLQRERRHCRHDVRHQLRIQEVGINQSISQLFDISYGYKR